jgi:glycosyltransferase involved in cell wall biosynthesis
LEGFISLFVAPSEFMRSRLIEWGIHADRVVLIRNFTSPSFEGPGEIGGFGIYLGRLSPEKGLDWLLRSLKEAGDPPFKIVGGGPLTSTLQAMISDLRLVNTELTGWVDPEESQRLLRQSRFVAFPSVWHENAPLAALEAMAAARPIVVSRMGGLPELAAAGRGIICNLNDRSSLARAIARVMDRPEDAEVMGRKGLAFVNEHCLEEIHGSNLEQAYGGLIGS